MTARFVTSTLADGPMGRTQLMTEEHCARRAAFLRNAFGVPSAPVMLTSAHSNEIAVVTAADAGRTIENVDGLMTGDVGLPLVVTHQDCVPILLTDDRNVVAALHAGWRGVMAGILPNAVALAASAFRVPASRLRVHLGPCIQPCHFFVDQDVADHFSSLVMTQVGEKYAIDLHRALRSQAQNAGVSDTAITVDARCTFCLQNEDCHLFPSWRRDKRADANMISAAIL